MKVLESLDHLGQQKGGTVLLAATTAVSVAVTIWCHMGLGIELAYTHAFYIPVCLAGLWRGRRGIWIPAIIGTSVIVSHYFSPLPDPPFYDGFRSLMLLVVGWLVGSLADHHRQAERQLREMNVTKDKFFSIISHDLRSPFQSLLLLSDELSRGVGSMPPERIQVYARGINVSSKRLLGLAEDLLEWSRIETGTISRTPGEADLAALSAEIGDVYHEFAERKGVRLEIAVSSPSVAWADARHVRCVLRNLLSNAIKFTQRGGAVRVAASAAGSAVSLTVADTGVGIPPEAMPTLFRIDVPHTTRGTDSERGSGLGLILTRELVELNGGTLTIDSTPGAGTTVTVTLPGTRR